MIPDSENNVITDTHVFFYGVSLGLIVGLPIIGLIYVSIIK